MKKYAIVKNNVVENVILWDGVSKWTTDGSIIEIPEGSVIGPHYIKDGENWIEPNYEEFYGDSV